MRSYNGYYWSNWSIPVPLSKHHVLDPQCTGLPELSTTQRPLVSSSPAVTVTVTPGNSCTMTSLRMSDMTILLNSSITGPRPAFLCVWSHSCLRGSTILYSLQALPSREQVIIVNNNSCDNCSIYLIQYRLNKLLAAFSSSHDKRFKEKLDNFEAKINELLRKTSIKKNI